MSMNFNLSISISDISDGSVDFTNIPKLELFCSNYLKLSYLISSNNLSFNPSPYSPIESFSRMACLCYHKSLLTLEELSTLLDLHPNSCKRCCDCYSV